MTTNMFSETAMSRYLTLKTALESFHCLPDQLDDSERNRLAQMVVRQQQIQQAILASDESSRVHISFQTVTEALQTLASRFESGSEFDALLAQYQLDRVALRQVLEYELLCDTTLEYVARHASELSDTEAEAYYFQNQAKFSQPERRETSHILITINDEFIENTPTAALTRCTEIRKQANQHNFALLALRHSECPTALNEGKLGLVSQGQLHPPLDRALFKMAQGDISHPIETDIGMHLLYCQRIVAAHRVSFAAAKTQIKQKHQQREKARLQKRWIQQLMIAA